MRKWLWITLGVLLIAGTVFAVGPRPEINTQIVFKGKELPEDLDAYLSAQESQHSDIREGLEKEIIWAYPASKAKTPLAIIYIHGFSASKGEIRPVPDRVAKNVNANLFFTRLSGHGRTSNAMAEPGVQDWINDIAQALAIGRELGERTVVIAGSTGGSLMTVAATHPDLQTQFEGLVLLSPNYGLMAQGSSLLVMPWGEHMANLIIGKQREFETINQAHGHNWTTSYPTRSLIPMAALANFAASQPVHKADKPALFIYSKQDSVVNPASTERILNRWGGPVESVVIDDADDKNKHVLAGDILSPSTTSEMVSQITKWLAANGFGKTTNGEVPAP